MKSLLLLISLSLLLSCQFSKGVKKDLGTGLSASYNGFALEDVYLTSGAEDTRLSNNKITLGNKVSIVVTGVEHYAEQNGVVFPGCTIILKDKTGKELLNLPNAFEHLKDGQPKAEASTLKAILTTGDPMVAGETYHLEARFYDLHKKENTIMTNVDLVAQ
jgi:hypothetical protein